mmetsp:Transcript_109075/g.163119  ORF Transcript_109075/g.163119 Transcript_109075/m.163119 type:complete len:284 (+) Transcript_109075:730-1581(+)
MGPCHVVQLLQGCQGSLRQEEQCQVRWRRSLHGRGLPWQLVFQGCPGRCCWQGFDDVPARWQGLRQVQSFPRVPDQVGVAGFLDEDPQPEQGRNAILVRDQAEDAQHVPSLRRAPAVHLDRQQASPNKCPPRRRSLAPRCRHMEVEHWSPARVQGRPPCLPQDPPEGSDSRRSGLSRSGAGAGLGGRSLRPPAVLHRVHVVHGYLEGRALRLLHPSRSQLWPSPLPPWPRGRLLVCPRRPRHRPWQELRLCARGCPQRPLGAPGTLPLWQVLRSPLPLAARHA